ncbi:MAG: hypothetical protein ACREIQ_02615, partial [Nitrospiria bacterium]
LDRGRESPSFLRGRIMEAPIKALEGRVDELTRRLILITTEVERRLKKLELEMMMGQNGQKMHQLALDAIIADVTFLMEDNYEDMEEEPAEAEVVTRESVCVVTPTPEEGRRI